MAATLTLAEEEENMIDFAERPSTERDYYRAIVESAGAIVTGYLGAGLSLHLPRGGAAMEHFEAHGLTLRPHSLFWFPLGSDNPPAEYRHDGRYPGSRGFWLCATFDPPETAEEKEESHA